MKKRQEPLSKAQERDNEVARVSGLMANCVKKARDVEYLTVALARTQADVAQLEAEIDEGKAKIRALVG